MYTKSPSCRSDASGSSRMTMSTESQVGPPTVQGMSGPERSVRMRYFNPSLLSITPPKRPASQCIQRLPARVAVPSTRQTRSEEHTSELQSPCNLVCRLLLEKKKKNKKVYLVIKKKKKKR